MFVGAFGAEPTWFDGGSVPSPGIVCRGVSRPSFIYRAVVLPGLTSFVGVLAFPAFDLGEPRFESAFHALFRGGVVDAVFEAVGEALH